MLFGYVKVDRANLLGKDYDAYRAVYCSLCKTLGKEYSIFSRFLLSYDCTFFAVVAVSLGDSCPGYQAGRCRFNPLKRCHYTKHADKALSLAAALCVIAAYFKLIDNIHDSPWYKRIFYRLLQPSLSRWRKKAQKRYPDIDELLLTMTRSQHDAESDPACSIDQAAEPTAKMLSGMFSLLPQYVSMKPSFDRSTAERVLSAFGYFLGRWIYLMDAADDYDKDQKRGNFNPLLLAHIERDQLAEQLEPMLNHALSQTLLSYGLFEKGVYDRIIENVLKDACPIEMQKVLKPYINGDKDEESL